MASVFKQVEIVGTVGNVYELRSVGKNNRSVVDFSVAVTPRRRGDDGEWTDGTTVWTNCTAWGRTAENVAEGFNKGDRVFLKGRADMKSGYTNRNGDEVPPREIVIVEYAGHENTWSVTSQDRTRKGSSKPQTSNRSDETREVKKDKPKDDPVTESLDLDLDLDDDLDSDELPF